MLSLLAALAVAASTATAAVHDGPSSEMKVVKMGPLPPAPASKTTINGRTYEYEKLAGYGFVKSQAVDKFGDTLGGLGSAIHIDQRSWKKDKDTYTGTLWSLPDRGWNTNGTLNFQPRLHKFTVTLTLAPEARADNPVPPNLVLKYLDTILFTGPDGKPTTGLDADAKGHLSYPGFPDLPAATIVGDGFGNGGKETDRRVSLDCEGLVVNDDGSFWISDEYGPYIYLLDKTGKIVSAIRPPDALIPIRKGEESFSSATPPLYLGDAGLPKPEHPVTGRENNHGFEGLSVSADGKTLWALMQSALVQEGGLEDETARYTRLLGYDISDPHSPKYKASYVVPLPLFTDAKGKTTVAAQSELHALANGQFLILARDGGAGRGEKRTTSLYRHIDVFDIACASDLSRSPKNRYDRSDGRIASKKGKLRKKVLPVTYAPGAFVDFNVKDELARFKLHNGDPQDAGLLNPKWESIALAPVDPGDSASDEYFLFSLSDNDFITQSGRHNGGKYHYKDTSGYDLDSQALVFKVRIPNPAPTAHKRT